MFPQNWQFIVKQQIIWCRNKQSIERNRAYMPDKGPDPINIDIFFFTIKAYMAYKIISVLILLEMSESQIRYLKSTEKDKPTH